MDYKAVNAEQGEKRSQLVILVHGIRTRAKWMTNVRPILQANGFEVAPSNFGKYDLFRFLVPLPMFKRAAVERVWIDIQSAIDLHPGLPVSFIAHSFGTLVVAMILKKEFRFRAHRVIFCGSIVPFDYPFCQIKDRFISPVLNEVGTRDFWPAIAESVTWGYGSTGTHQFNKPYVLDRCHKGADHSHFLTAEFCAKYWVPYLRNGEVIGGDGDSESSSAPWWIDAISVLRIRYVALALVAVLVLWSWCRPDSVRLEIPPTAFMHQPTKKIKTHVREAPCYLVCEWVGCSPCGRTMTVAPEVEGLVVCLGRTALVSYRDPFDGMRQLVALAPSCLEITEVGNKRMEVNLAKPPATFTSIVGAKGDVRNICGTAPTCASSVKAALD